MIGPTVALVPHAERTPVPVGASGAGVVRGDGVQVLITI
jgi:hypothetical protein